MAELRWPDGQALCPRCKSTNAGFLKTRKLWKSRDCARQFSVKAGTVFEDSPLGLDKWLPCVWLIVNAKNRIGSCEIGRALGATQKTGWFMLHRVRLAMQNSSFVKMRGTVEADETFIGGLAKNMREGESARKIKGRGTSGKAVVMGLLERGDKARPSRIRAELVVTTDRHNLRGEIEGNVAKGPCVFTDALPAYSGMSEPTFALEYVRGMVHTNGLESFWATLKSELLQDHFFATSAEAKSALFDYIKVFYNRRRLHSALGFQSPVDYENNLS